MPKSPDYADAMKRGVLEAALKQPMNHVAFGCVFDIDGRETVFVHGIPTKFTRTEPSPSDTLCRLGLWQVARAVYIGDKAEEVTCPGCERKMLIRTELMLREPAERYLTTLDLAEVSEAFRVAADAEFVLALKKRK